MTKPWKWQPRGPGTWALVDPRGRKRADVWANGVWHTWDTDGVGGENGSCDGRDKIRDAMDQVMAAVVRQGWVAWKVEYGKA
jgi:hypothetical protein